jgi:hypothetical protein
VKSGQIVVEVVYAEPRQVWHQTVELNPGSSIFEAILASGFHRLGLFDLTQCAVGVFGKLASLDDEIKAGDRVEIYRPLIADPKEARRRRAKHRASKVGAKAR